MPQLTLEFSSNIIEKTNMTSLFKKCHIVLEKTLPTDIQHCKSRAIECRDFYMGDGNKSNAFIHVTLQVLQGRTEETLKNVAVSLMSILKENFADSLKKLNLQITLSLTELPAIYLKLTS